MIPLINPKEHSLEKDKDIQENDETGKTLPHELEPKKESIWAVLYDKPTNEDIEADIQLRKSNPKTPAMTTRTELWVWYLASFARAPFVMVISALIFPIHLALLATRHGCLENTPNGCDYFNEPISAPSSTLVVNIGSWELKPESFATLMISLAGILQIIAYLWCSSIADYKNYQMHMFRISLLIGNILVIFWFLVADEPNHWLLAGIFGAFTYVPLNVSWICYNAYLPVFVENHWLIRRLEKEYENDKENVNVTFNNKYKHLIKTLQDEMSQFGFATGYIGGFFVIAFAAVGFVFLEDITTEIIKSTDYGMSYKYTHTFDEEYWMKPVVGIDVWYSMVYAVDVNNVNNTINKSYINAIELQYEHQNNGDSLNGSIYGATDMSDFNINNNNSANSDWLITDVQLMHSHFTIDDDDIIEIILYKTESYEPKSINAIQFNLKDSDDIMIGINTNNDGNNMEIATVKPDQFPDYTLCGYQVTTGIHNDSVLPMSMPIIYKLSFVFMDSKQGQYGSTLDNRLLYSMSGIWYLLLSIPAMLFIQTRNKPDLPDGASICTVSFTDYAHIIKHATDYPNLFRYLIAWFIWSDAENTTSVIGVLFAQIELGMTNFELILFLLELQIVAGLGNIFFVWFQKQFKVSSKNLLVAHLFINMLLPIWATFGFTNWGFGLVQPWEMYVVVMLLYGSQIGSMFSMSRSLYGHMIPKGYESQFYGLYQFTNVGSSWIGPLLATFISNEANLRYAVVYIGFFYLVSIPIIQFGVNYEQGMVQAGKVAEYHDEQSAIVDKEIASSNSELISDSDKTDGRSEMVSVSSYGTN